MTEYQMIINPRALQQYIDLMGDEGNDFVVEIIDTLLEDATNNLQILGQSLKEDDSKTFRRIAHTLKTGCATVGATELAEKFLTLETAGAEGNLASVGDLFDHCKNDFRVLTAELLDMKRKLST